MRSANLKTGNMSYVAVCKVNFYVIYNIMKIEMVSVWNVTHLCPGSEPTRFSIVVIIGHCHFRAYQQYLTIEKGNATIVGNIAMHNGHSNIDEHIFAAK